VDRSEVASKPVVNQPSPPEDSSVWDRLHASMERLGAGARSASDPAALANKLANRAKLLRGQVGDAKPAEAPLIFVAFNSGHARYGVLVDDVLEVQALNHFTFVPKTPPFIPGVVHWRGSILPLLDFSHLFGLPETGLADVHIYLVVEAAGRRVGLVAREIEDVYSVPRNCIQTAPQLAGNVPAEWIIGVHDHQRLIVSMAPILQDPRLVEWRKSL
jgi:purine-binding chemotaxis protein CheW